MARLHIVVNDGSVPIETRKQFATLVLEANRSHMVATGTLDADEPIHLIFHGAPEGRSSSIRKEGIDLSKLKSGSADDFGRGLYLSRDLESAYLYAQRNFDAGELFPFLVRQRDLGEVVDVREAGKHRAAWDEFLDREPAAYPPYARALIKNAREWATATGKYRPNEPERGLVFEAFLREQGLSKAAVIHGELGKDALTGGIGRGDQFSLRAQLVADIFNEQLGFRRAQPTPVEEPVLRAIDDKKGKARAPAEAQPEQPKQPKAKQPKAKPPRAKQPKAKSGKAAGKRREADQAIGAEKTAEGAPQDAAAPPAGTKPAKQRQGARPLDLGEAEAATRKRKAEESKAKEAEAEEERLRQEAGDPEAAVEKVAAARPVSTPEAEEIIDRITREYPDPEGTRVTREQKLEVLESRVDELDLIIRLDKDLTPSTREFLKWKEAAWRQVIARHSVETAAKRTIVVGLGDTGEVPEPLRKRVDKVRDAGETKTEVSIAKQRVVAAEMRAQGAREEETKATRSVKEEMRREGKNYEAKKKAEFDEVLGLERFEARQAEARQEGKDPILLSPDHLVPLADVSNMEELKPIFAIYNRALGPHRDVIRNELRALGDVPENLVALQRYPNEHIKGAKPWSECDRVALAKHGYTDGDVNAMIERELKMRAKIIEIIEEMIIRHSARLAAERPHSFKQLIQIEEPGEPVEDPVDG